MNNFVEEKNLYKITWSSALRVLLGWTSEQVASWSSIWEDGLNDTDQDGFFYHEEPLYYVAHLFVPPDLEEKLNPKEANHLLNDIKQAIKSVDPQFDTNPDFDWQAAKFRVNQVISSYRSRMTPNI